MAIEVWQELLAYQSGDLVQRLYEHRNQRSLNRETALEIRAHFVQGASYFQAAKGVADVVKPLILYYGCLALSRGAILFLSGRREATLKESHGLAVGHWKHDLSSGNQGIIGLALKLTNGTFRELFEAAANKNYLSCPQPFSQSYPADLTSGRLINIREVVSRIPRLKPVYEETMCQPSNCIPASNIQLPNVAVNINSSKEMIVEIRSHDKIRLLAPDGTLARLRKLPGVTVTRDDDEELQIRWLMEDGGRRHSAVPIATGPEGPG